MGDISIAEAHASHKVMAFLESYGHSLAAFQLKEYLKSPSETQLDGRVSQMLAAAAPDILYVSGSPWWQILLKLTSSSLTDDILCSPRVLLSRATNLRSLRVFGSLDVPEVLQLKAMAQLTCVELMRIPELEALQLMCQTLALSRLQMRYHPEEELADASASQNVVELLADSPLAASLRELSFECHPAAVSGLGALASLTSLTVDTCACTGLRFESFSGLSCLTNLLSLDIEFVHETRGTREHCGPDFATVTALTRLTHLGICDGEGIRECCGKNACRCKHSWLSNLSRLTALAELRLPHICMAAGRPRMSHGRSLLPSELLVLRSATALKLLDLAFEGRFWSQLDKGACRALQEAVAGLSKLKALKLRVSSVGPQQSCLPLAVFSAAPSVESFTYYVDY